MGRHFQVSTFSILSLSFISFVVGDTCSTISNTSNIDVKTALSTEYASEQSDYWSTGCSNLKPSCILYPKSAEEVATILRSIHDNNETFVVKSGGHNPNKHFASIDGGPLISTRKLNEVIYDAASSTVRVGPGNDWENVHEALKDTGVTVVGGRIGGVGVGGYVLGGGLSFLSTQYGT